MSKHVDTLGFVLHLTVARSCGKPDIFLKIKDFGKSSQTSSG